MSTVHVVGWPRWMRDEVTLHPSCENLGIQKMVSEDSVPTEGCAVVHLQDPGSEREFRRTLTNMTDDVACVVLSGGVDANGTVHDAEFVMFCPLGEQREENAVHAALYHFRRWQRQPRTFATAEEQPTWLVEAEARVDELELVTTEARGEAQENDSSVVVEEKTAKETRVEAVAQENDSSAVEEEKTAKEMRVVEAVAQESVSVVVEEEKTTEKTPEKNAVTRVVGSQTTLGNPLATTTFRTNDDGIAMTLVGVLPPDVLSSIAQPNTIVYLPVHGGGRVSITRVRNDVWLGAYVVDLTTWSDTERNFVVAPRHPRSQMAPRRTVTQVHRLKRQQFERR